MTSILRHDYNIALAMLYISKFMECMYQNIIKYLPVLIF